MLPVYTHLNFIEQIKKFCHIFVGISKMKILFHHDFYFCQSQLLNFLRYFKLQNVLKGNDSQQFIQDAVFCIFIITSMEHHIYQMEIIFMLAIYVSGLTLGDNLIINGRFEEPSLISQGIEWTNFPKHIPGWTCTNNCEINNCELSIKSYLAWNRLFGDCKGQVLDISSNQNQEITQIFQATYQGNYLLTVKFYLPTFNAQLKTFLIYLNGVNIFTYQPQTLIIADAFYFNKSVLLIRGNNNLTFADGGQDDSNGFRLSSVQVRKYINEEIQQFINNLFNNDLIINAISVPGSRILLGSITNTLVSFDRMQLYYFHNRNYSYYTTLFFSSISNLLDSKSELSLVVAKQAFRITPLQEQNFISAFEYKQKYIHANMLTRSSNGYGFVSNNVDLVLYSLPFYIASIALLYVVFRLTFNYRVSKAVRKYSFYGVIFIQMVCQGNIEQYSFYCFGEFLNFFSADSKHKIVNCVILGFYFLAWGKYKKKTKYFTDGFQLNLGGVLAFTLSNGFICLFLGALHYLLLNYPNLQLFALGAVQVLWILGQLLLVNLKLCKMNFFIGINILQSILRVSLQLSLYLYSTANNPSDGDFINSYIHLNQIFLFISFRIICFTSYTFLLVRGSLQFLSKNIQTVPYLPKKKDLKNKKNDLKIKSKILKNKEKVFNKNKINFTFIKQPIDYQK